MTINKAQGESVRVVGIDLRRPMSAHGQLYVSVSRATSHDQINILLSGPRQEDTATNVVYPDVLLR